MTWHRFCKVYQLKNLPIKNKTNGGSVRIKKDNIIIRSATIDDAIQSKYPIDRIIWDTMLENERAQYVYEYKIKARKL